MALQFPNIKQPSYPFKETPENPAITSKQENGIVVSRMRYTRNRETFILSWDSLPNADYSILRNFYKNVVFGGSLIFEWIYPVVIGDDYSGNTYSVRFVGSPPDFQLYDFSKRKGQITLEEV